MPPLYTRLLKSLGKRQAALELSWMKQALLKDARLPSIEHMVRRRITGEPLQYILGTTPFGPLNLLTRKPVLIPRPETEDWAIRLSEYISPTPENPVSLLDLGTGTGCIPLLLCHLWPSKSIDAIAVDISPEAVLLAAENAQQSHVFERNSFKVLHADYTSATFLTDASGIIPPFDVVTSNPPYISATDYLALPRSVKNHEDPQALAGGDDGLAYYRVIAHLVSRKGFIAPNGLVVLEVGDGQANSVVQIMRTDGGLNNIQIWSDPWGKERTVLGRRS